MQRFGTVATAVIASLILPGTVFAQASVLTGREARDVLFPPGRSEAVTLPDPALTAADLTVIEQIAATQEYYGAVALSPDEGLASQATVAAVGYHDVTAAAIVARTDCNAKRRVDTAECIVVAEIRPQGWEPRSLQLGTDATEAFRKDYGRGRASRAMAISAATGKWGIARGDGAAQAALAECAVQSGAQDCRIVIAD